MLALNFGREEHDAAKRHSDVARLRRFLFRFSCIGLVDIVPWYLA